MVKMTEVQEERFGHKGTTRHAPLKNKGIQDDSLVVDDEYEAPPGTHRGLFKNKEIQDRLVTEYTAKRAQLVADTDSIGILSYDKKSITSVDPQDQIEEEVLSVSQPQDVDTRQVQAQGRRLDAATFLTRCESTSGLSGSDAYVDCDNGFVRGDPFLTSCEEACGVDCCTGTGDDACVGFTGKGKSRRLYPFMCYFDFTICKMFMNHFVRITY